MFHADEPNNRKAVRDYYSRLDADVVHRRAVALFDLQERCRGIRAAIRKWGLASRQTLPRLRGRVSRAMPRRDVKGVGRGWGGTSYLDESTSERSLAGEDH
jgi:hypothetical protein